MANAKAVDVLDAAAVKKTIGTIDSVIWTAVEPAIGTGTGASAIATIPDPGGQMRLTEVHVSFDNPPNGPAPRLIVADDDGAIFFDQYVPNQALHHIFRSPPWVTQGEDLTATVTGGDAGVNCKITLCGDKQ